MRLRLLRFLLSNQKVRDSNPWSKLYLMSFKLTALNHSANSLYKWFSRDSNTDFYPYQEYALPIKRENLKIKFIICNKSIQTWTENEKFEVSEFTINLCSFYIIHKNRKERDSNSQVLKTTFSKHITLPMETFP